MRRKNISRDEQAKLVMECRTSGLSDYQWCQQQGIHASSFYNWVSRLRKVGYTFPEPVKKKDALPIKQEVVRLEVLQEEDRTHMIEQQNAPSVNPLIQNPSNALAVEIQMAGATVKFFNNANPELLKCTLELLGGASRAW